MNTRRITVPQGLDDLQESNMTISTSCFPSSIFYSTVIIWPQNSYAFIFVPKCNNAASLVKFSRYRVTSTVNTFLESGCMHGWTGQKYCASAAEAQKAYQQSRLTLSSKAPTATPDAAPDPARPMKCSLPMLLANNDAPTCNVTVYNTCIHGYSCWQTYGQKKSTN